MIADFIVDALRWGEWENEKRDAMQRPRGKTFARIGSSQGI
jgi:hypothetical protein